MMEKKKPWIVFAAVVVVLLGLTVPLQFLVRKEVVVGLEAETAHAHAHGEEEHEDEYEHEHEHEHPEEEGHLGAEVSLGTNLIANYGFEVGTRGQIWGWAQGGLGQGAVIYRDDIVSRSGRASAAVITGSASVMDAGWFMKLDELPRAHDVIFEGYIKTEGLHGEAYLKVLAEGRTGEEENSFVLVSASSDDVDGDSDWTLSSLRCYIPPEATMVWLEVGIYGNGKAWFDDMSLVVEEREDTLASGVNLLENPSFDQGLKHWHLFSLTPEPVLEYGVLPVGPNGGLALFLQDHVPGTPEDKHTGFHQAICGFYGHQGTLEIHGWIRGEELDGEGRVDVVAFTTAGTVDLRFSQGIAVGEDWSEFRAEMPIDGEVASIWIRVNLDGNGRLFVDGLEAICRE
jgi:hypothetical protein